MPQSAVKAFGGAGGFEPLGKDLHSTSGPARTCGWLLLQQVGRSLGGEFPGVVDHAVQIIHEHNQILAAALQQRDIRQHRGGHAVYQDLDKELVMIHVLNFLLPQLRGKA